LHGFDAFDTVSIESPVAAPRALALNTTTLRASMPQRAAPISPAPRKIESTAATPAISALPVFAPSLQPAPAAIIGNDDVAVGENAIAPHLPFTLSPHTAANENDEETLVSVTSDAQDDSEPLIAASPSMAPQATPVEMSDDGEIAPSAPESDG
jgi:hypothetical protein